MIYPSAVSPDGSVLLYTRAEGLSTDLWYVSLDADRRSHPFVQTAAQERDGQFSPDGKWVAYQSNEAGHAEIYLRPFPGPGDRIQVSAAGGSHVRWAANGSELFYVAADQRLTSVRVAFGANGTPVLGTPISLFRTELDSSALARQQYVVSPDGQRFLINAATDAIEPPSITLILNWQEGLKRQPD
jgi:dipeptidyl aminopeptidase/acylaminoacyl peptidase